MNYKQINARLLILPIVIILCITMLSYFFSQKIEYLKKEIDLVYFGNYIPVDTLYSIKDNYEQILKKRRVTSRLKSSILTKWKQYNSGYQTIEEKKQLKKINYRIYHNFKLRKLRNFKQNIKDIKYLIAYEAQIASKQRKEFLTNYSQIKNHLLYAQIIIIVIVLLITAYIIYQEIIALNHLKRLNEQYKIEANTDGLTNLYNRKYFDTIFKELIPISYENNWTSVFVMIDIDFFKQYNDTYGHDAGDIALKSVAKILDTIIDKEYEYPFRLGGEEFGIIIFNTNEKYVQYTLNNIQYSLKQLQIPHSASKTNFLTISMGVAMVNKNTYNLNFQQLYNLADEKLYYSKEHGRDQYTF